VLTHAGRIPHENSNHDFIVILPRNVTDDGLPFTAAQELSLELVALHIDRYALRHDYHAIGNSYKSMKINGGQVGSLKSVVIRSAIESNKLPVNRNRRQRN
jgi:hypothetical protein